MTLAREANAQRAESARWELPAAAAAIGLLILALFATAPKDGDFWWSEAPRNALDAVFYWDLLTTLPLSDPVGWAKAYYAHYPALTVLFYPPMFHVVSAPFVGFLGISHAAALVPEMLFYGALGLGVFRLARRWLGFGAALGAALALCGAPEVALWGRQVMLEIPSFALLVWAMVMVFDYGDRREPWRLYNAAFLLLAAAYTKQTVVFILPVVALAVLLSDGWAALRRRSIWLLVGLFALAAAPLVAMTLELGSANVQSVVDIPDAAVGRNTLAGWIWYLRQLPDQLGWPLLGAALVGAIGTVLSPRWRLPRRDTVILAAWFAAGYLFFSAIDLKEARHDLYILLPIVILAFLPFDRGLPGTLGSVAAIAASIAVAATTLAVHPVPFMKGYREAAAEVARAAPDKAAILFSGQRDGSFIFAMRAQVDRPDLSVLRADKLFLNLKIRRTLGVAQKDYDENEIADLLRRCGVTHVVAQTDFWTDLKEMARLQSVLRSAPFEVIARIPVVANVPTDDKELVIYRSREPVAGTPRNCNQSPSAL